LKTYPELESPSAGSADRTLRYVQHYGFFLRFAFPIVLSLLLILFVFPTGLFLAISIPLGQVPDEAAHVARMESLLHREIVGRREAGPDFDGHPIALPGVLINAGPFIVTSKAIDAAAGHKITADILDRLDHIPWGTQLSFVYAPNTAVYFPMFYLPGAFGLGLARLSGLTPFGAVLVARVVNLCAYIAVAVLALIIAQRGWCLMFGTLALPMTLWLAASCNEDGLLIACSCLAAALLTRASGPKGALYWSAAVCFACIIAVKPAYVPLVAFMLLPCRCFTKSDLLSGGYGMLAASLPGMIWAFLTLRYVSGPFDWWVSYHPGPLWPGDPTRVFAGTDPMAQAMVFIHRPSLMLTLPMRTIYASGLRYLHQAVGGLGLLNLTIAEGLFDFWLIALGFAVLGDVLATGHDDRARIYFALIALLSVVATVFAIFDAEYLTWSTVGNSPVIDGFQGRYILPLLPLIGITLPSLQLPMRGWSRVALAGPVVAAAAVGMAYLPILVIKTYYLAH
jgi:uncharacterized membrane protein